MWALLLLCLCLSACGGGGGAAVATATTPPPQCCESTALIAADFDDAERAELADYDTRQNNIGCCDGTHLKAMRDNAITAADLWAQRAFQIVDGRARSAQIDKAAVGNLVEDHRLSMFDHMLAAYDQDTSGPGWAGNQSAVQSARQQLVDGVNAEFDQLQIDLQNAGYG